MSRTGFLTDEWFVSPPLRWPSQSNDFVVIEARTPVVRWAWDTGERGKFARWVIETISKYEKDPAWAIWRMPPTYWTMRFYRVSFIERLAGYFLCAWVIWKGVVQR